MRAVEEWSDYSHKDHMGMLDDWTRTLVRLSRFRRGFS
jgi:hypothetical protein